MYICKHEPDGWHIYRADAKGRPIGKSMGRHDNESEARHAIAKRAILDAQHKASGAQGVSIGRREGMY